MADSRMDDARARLRDMALPWESAHVLAHRCAAQTVGAMQASFSACADADPYDTGDHTAHALSGPRPAEGPAVEAMAKVFISILNRRGLIRIDPG